MTTDTNEPIDEEVVKPAEEQTEQQPLPEESTPSPEVPETPGTTDGEQSEEPVV